MVNNGILCLASEKAKIVVNKCLDKGIDINTFKLEELLIFIHTATLVKLNRPFFNQNVIATEQGLIIKEIEEDFKPYVIKFKDKFTEYISLLDDEEEIVNDVIERYRNLKTIGIDIKDKFELLNKMYYQNSDSNIVTNEMIQGEFAEEDLFGIYCNNDKRNYSHNKIKIIKYI